MSTAAVAFPLTTVRQRLFDADDDGGRCRKFMVAVRGDSEFGVLINIPGLHAEDEWFGMPPGSAQEFEVPSARQVNGITDVYAKGDEGTASIDFGIVSRINS